MKKQIILVYTIIGCGTFIGFGVLFLLYGLFCATLLALQLGCILLFIVFSGLIPASIWSYYKQHYLEKQS